LEESDEKCFPDISEFWQSTFKTSHFTSAAIFEMPLGFASASPISLNWETSNSPKVFTKLSTKFKKFAWT